MPLRVRVTTTTGGAAALQWLGTYVGLAVNVCDGKVGERKIGTSETSVDIDFSRKGDASDFMKLMGPMNEAPLVADVGPIVKVEEV